MYLHLHDQATRLALVYACEEAGLRQLRAPKHDTVVVSDQLVTMAGHGVDVLVVEPTPAACQRGMAAFVAGQARAVVAATEPASLPQAVALCGAGFGVVPRLVVDAAARMPNLPPRLQHILELVLRGRTNHDIARTLHLSLSVTKRNVQTLLQVFDAPNRQGLVAAAVRMGIRPGTFPR